MNDTLSNTIQDISVKKVRKGFYIRVFESNVFQKVTKVIRKGAYSRFHLAPTKGSSKIGVELWNGQDVEYRKTI